MKSNKKHEELTVELADAQRRIREMQDIILSCQRCCSRYLDLVECKRCGSSEFRMYGKTLKNESFRRIVFSCLECDLNHYLHASGHEFSFKMLEKKEGK